MTDQVECMACAGSGFDRCSCCGGEIECEDCGGTGYVDDDDVGYQ